MLLAFDDYALQSRKLADALEMPLHIIQRHRFPDDEYRITLPPALSGQVVICQSLNHPNEKLVELLLVAKTARELGAENLTLVAPYLCYMRQDKAFHPGEAVSQTIIGGFLADLFDTIITVDPHLHRIRHLHQAVPATNALALTATPLMAEFLRGRVDKPILLGPDKEAEQWVSSVAAPNHWPYGVCSKTRLGDEQVEIELPEISLQGRNVVLVDDVASSGQTLMTAARKCLARQAGQVDVLVTHALFFNDAEQRMKEAGVRHVWSTDSVMHDSNVIPLVNLLKDAVSNLARGRRRIR
ncbi:MAG: ribose-phosphate diphosphokinase [Gammaproteobacteria bacterium]|nr:ribose-phosphate diphosphokinase [Gammaproteobacteria bacterium]MDH3447616.1 ribose-phosphate diphosphokinase [Gammaproteobacteria bacterium]